MRKMADLCGFSKAYVGVLEQGINPTNNKPISPTIQTLEKIAKATGYDVDYLLNNIDNLSAVQTSSDESILLDGFRHLNSEGQQLMLGMLGSLRISHAAVPEAIG